MFRLMLLLLLGGSVSLAACSASPTENIPVTDEVSTAMVPVESTHSHNPDLNYAQVEFVRATLNGDGTWKFDATVRHQDEGWDHYADAWQVVGPEGDVLAERVLTHPHDNEQPFTRSQSNITIPTELATGRCAPNVMCMALGGRKLWWI